MERISTKSPEQTIGQRGESDKMAAPKRLIEIRKDPDPDSRSFYTRTDGDDDPGYTKEGEFSDRVRYFLRKNPDGEVIVRNTPERKEKLMKKTDSESDDEDD